MYKMQSKHNKHHSHGRMYYARVRGEARVLQGVFVVWFECASLDALLHVKQSSDRRALPVVKPTKKQLAIDELGKDSSSCSSRYLTC